MHVADLGDPSLGARFERIQKMSAALLAIAGIVAGWLAACAVFFYDGSHPVNVVRVLAVFVGLQFVLLACLAVTMLPAACLEKIPGAPSVQGLLRSISPGNLRRLLFRWLPASIRSDANDLLARGRYHHVVFGRVEKWGILSGAQSFAVAFYVGALAGCLYLIIFSDLAFGWSTTLQAEAAGIHRLTSALSAPWAALIPGAAPSLELVEATRYFRIESGSPPAVQAELLGGWWPFLVACMVVYGLVPRIISFGFCKWRYNTALRYGVLHAPGVQNVLDRLNRALVSTRAEDRAEAPSRTNEDDGAAPAAVREAQQRHILIRWAGAGPGDTGIREWAVTRLGATACDIFDAGGNASVEVDEQSIDAVASAEDEASVFLLCKAWEPPIGECMDFLAALSSRIGAGRSVTILPLGRDDDGTGPEREHLRQWQRRVAQLGDPKLVVKRIDSAS